MLLIYGLWVGPKYDRFVLPAFDGHVYAAMAEDPRVFTLAPWGYRILEPWIVHLLPAPSAAVGFFWLNLGLLAAAVGALGAWLRRLGFSDTAAALASAAFAFSPPVRLLIEYQVLVDPLVLLLLAVILHETPEPDLLTLMALFAAVALSKEAGLTFLIVVPLALIPRVGILRGVIETGVVSAPAVWLSVLLRLTWGNPTPPPGFSILGLTLGRIIDSSVALASAAALSGLLFPALVGLFRERSIALRIQGFALWLSTFGLLLVNPYHYSVNDLPRLSVYAWPALLPLALAGLGFRRSEPPRLGPPTARFRTLASSGLLLLTLAAVGATDPYVRAPFLESPNPVALLGRIRESRKAAELLEGGLPFTFDAERGRFARPVTETFNLTEGRRQRWFLHRGFGRHAAFGTGAPEFQGEAEWILPLLTPRPARLSMRIEGPEGARVRVQVNGRSVGSFPAGAEPGELLLPRGALVRGDNLVTLRGPAGARLRLVHLEARLIPAAGPGPE